MDGTKPMSRAHQVQVRLRSAPSLPRPGPRPPTGPVPARFSNAEASSEVAAGTASSSASAVRAPARLANTRRSSSAASKGCPPGRNFSRAARRTAFGPLDPAGFPAGKRPVTGIPAPRPHSLQARRRSPVCPAPVTHPAQRCRRRHPSACSTGSRPRRGPAAAWPGHPATPRPRQGLHHEPVPPGDDLFIPRGLDPQRAGLPQRGERRFKGRPFPRLRGARERNGQLRFLVPGFLGRAPVPQRPEDVPAIGQQRPASVRLKV